MSLLIVGLLVMVPVVESSFVDDVWFGITGFFSMLITGNVPGPNPEQCTDGTSPEECSNNQPFYCEVAGEDMGDGVLAVVFNLVEDCGLCGCPDGENCSKDGSCEVFLPENETVVCAEVSCGDEYGSLCEGEITNECVGEEVCTNTELGWACDTVEAPNHCGNGMVDSGEVCDGTNLTGQTCVSQGFASGTLACKDTCLGFDTSSCVPFNVTNGTGPDDTDPDDTDPTTPKTCNSIGGKCTDICEAGYLAYNEDSLSITCDQSYATSVHLMCCVLSDSEAFSEENSTSEDNEDGIDKSDSASKNLRESLKSPTESGSKNFVPEDATGLQKLFSNISYGMGSVWVIFALVVVIVGITYFLHGRFNKK